MGGVAGLVAVYRERKRGGRGKDSSVKIEWAGGGGGGGDGEAEVSVYLDLARQRRNEGENVIFTIGTTSTVLVRYHTGTVLVRTVLYCTYTLYTVPYHTCLYAHTVLFYFPRTWTRGNHIRI